MKKTERQDMKGIENVDAKKILADFRAFVDSTGEWSPEETRMNRAAERLLTIAAGIPPERWMEPLKIAIERIERLLIETRQELRDEGIELG